MLSPTWPLGRDVHALLHADRLSGEAAPVYAHPLEARLQRLDETHAVLDALLANVYQGRTHSGAPIDLTPLDGYLAGVEGFNAGANRAVGVLLALVVQPPRWIIETPSKATLAHFHKPYTFDTLWDRYVRINEAFLRYVIRRFISESAALRGQSLPPCVAAFEIVNEPDYEWIPDEMRIEKALAPAANPVGKYVTELHLSQVPDRASFHEAFQVLPWGYGIQDASWRAEGEPLGILEFRWGAKFDWYVKCFAGFHERVSRAARDELSRVRGGDRVTLVSGAVTHNNLHYLIAMHRANPAVFEAVDAIGIHPYHWPRHDILDTHYVSPTPTDGWESATPRDYADRYFKRFDFLEQLAKLTREPDPRRSHGMSGKQLWITEFGLPTKKLGVFNAPLRQYVKFILQRGEPELEGLTCGVWEDLWDAFLSQVDARYLERNHVGAFCFYALRELGIRGFDLHDDDRSNLAIFHRDGSPRMAADTHERLTKFIHSVAGR